MSKPPMKFINEMAATIYITQKLTDSLGAMFKVELADSPIGSRMPQIVLMSAEGGAIGNAYANWIKPSDPQSTFALGLGVFRSWKGLIEKDNPSHGLIFVNAVQDLDGDSIRFLDTPEGANTFAIIAWDVEDKDVYYFNIRDESEGPIEFFPEEHDTEFVREFMNAIDVVFNSTPEGHDW